jgi:hypothetical protein
MIKTKKEFDKIIAEGEQAFQAYIFCPSQENEERYKAIKLRLSRAAFKIRHTQNY